MSAPVQLTSPVGTLLAVLIACACERLRAAGREVCDCCLIHAADVMPMDGCDCCADAGRSGRLSARVVQIGPAPTFTRAEQPGVKCGTSVLQVQIELGVMRCVTVPEDGSALDCAQAAAEVLGFLADEQALRWAVSCCPDTQKVRGRWAVTAQEWVPSGPMGGCAGGVLRVNAIGTASAPGTGGA